MVRVLSHLYENITSEYGFTCGFALESAFNDQRDIQLMLDWMKAKGFTEFGLVRLEHLMFKEEEQARRFAEIWPAMA